METTGPQRARVIASPELGPPEFGGPYAGTGEGWKPASANALALLIGKPGHLLVDRESAVSGTIVKGES